MKKPKPQSQMVFVHPLNEYIVPKRTKRGDRLVDRMVKEIAKALARRVEKNGS